MSVGNMFHKRRAAFDLREKAITTTYTVNVGGTADNFEEDRVITITNPAADFTITLPTGSYFGQEVLISLLANDADKTVTVSKQIPTGESGTVALGDVGDYASLEYVNDTTGWILLHYELDA